MAEAESKKRVRINISTTSKGLKSWDCTVEMVDTDQEVVLAESDRLVQSLSERYPVKVE